MVIASTASLPTPSHMKMLSTIAVPPKRLPADSASNVTMVVMADFNTLFRRITPFMILGAIDIALIFIYIMIWSNTRVRYRDEIKNCLNILESIKKNEKTARNIENNIIRTGDDSTYNLHEFDEQIAAANQKKAELQAQKAAAVNQFEAETRARLTDDIDLSYKDKVDSKLAEISAGTEAVNAAAKKATELETRLNNDFISYVGAKNISHERIERLIELIDSNEAATVSEAVSRLE